MFSDESQALLERDQGSCNACLGLARSEIYQVADCTIESRKMVEETRRELKEDIQPEQARLTIKT